MRGTDSNDDATTGIWLSESLGLACKLDSEDAGIIFAE